MEEIIYKKIRSLYDQGKFDECLERIKSPTSGDEYALGGWCHYRKGNYKTAREWFVKAGDVQFAREGLAYLAAYIDKDDETLERLAAELGDCVNVQNALAIRARDPEHNISPNWRSEMEGRANSVLSKNQGTSEANLCHNLGRLFLEKATGEEDLLTALDYFALAESFYGEDENWHHRAALNFWISKAYEKLKNKESAIKAARKSILLWARQITLDPKTASHVTKFNNAVNRLVELS